jgi:hypothetical protein
MDIKNWNFKPESREYHLRLKHLKQGGDFTEKEFAEILKNLDERASSLAVRGKRNKLISKFLGTFAEYAQSLIDHDMEPGNKNSPKFRRNLELLDQAFQDTAKLNSGNISNFSYEDLNKLYSNFSNTQVEIPVAGLSGMKSVEPLLILKESTGLKELDNLFSRSNNPIYETDKPFLIRTQANMDKKMDIINSHAGKIEEKLLNRCVAEVNNAVMQAIGDKTPA